MSTPLIRRIAFVLVFCLAAGFIEPPRARADSSSDSSNSNLTMGFAAVVIVVALVVAWEMDFGRDDDMITSTRDMRLSGEKDDRLALVLTDWQPADEERSEVISGVGFRAWF